MASISSALAGAASAPVETKPQEKSVASPGADKETFLKLLVAQIKNQNPLNPADGMQYVTQLAQFSSLEQLLGIRSDVQGLAQSLAGLQLPAATSISGEK